MSNFFAFGASPEVGNYFSRAPNTRLKVWHELFSKSHNVNVTVGWIQRKQSCSCTHHSINQHLCPSGLCRPFFLPSMHQRHFFFAPSKIKHSLDGKFLEAISQRNRLSRKPLWHISMSWLTIAFDDQFWVTTLPNHKQVWGSYCLQLTVLVTWCTV